MECVHRLMATSLLCSLLGILLPSTPQQPVEPPSAFGPPVFRGVCVDKEPGFDGVAARAETYKLLADQVGVTFVPLLGPGEIAHPLRFEVAGLWLDGEPMEIGKGGLPRAEGEEIHMAHRRFTERWSLRPREAEQSFVIETTARRSIELRVHVRGDLPLRVQGDGLVFDAGSAGGVEYRDFVIVDARGRARRMPIVGEDGDIVLRVGEADLLGLEFPLTLDPIVRAFGIDVGTTSTHHPEAAFDRSFARWAIVYADQVASNDSDVLAAHFDADGNFVAVTALDSTSSDSVAPSLAHDAQGNMFLCVWRDQDGAQQIRARRIQSNGFLPLTVQVVATASGTTSFTDPDVGGSNASAADRFLVVWGQYGLLGANSVVQMVNILVSGGLTNGQTLDPDTNCTRDLEIRVSKCAGAGQHWGVVFRHKRSCASLNHDIAFAAIRSDGTRMFGPTLVQTNGDGSDDHPDVAGDGTAFFVIFDRDAGTNGRDLVGAGYRRSGTSFSQTRTPLVMSAAEPGVDRALDQVAPAIDNDGCRFTYVYLDGSPARPRAATFMLVNNGASVSFETGAFLLDSSTLAHAAPSIAFVDELPVRSLLAWERTGTGANVDVRGVLYDALAPGTPIRFLSTGCGGVGAIDIAVSSSGNAVAIQPNVGTNAPTASRASTASTGTARGTRFRPAMRRSFRLLGCGVDTSGNPNAPVP